MVATAFSMIMLVALCCAMNLVPGFESMMVIHRGCFELFFMVTFFLSLSPWMFMLFLSQGAETQPITMAALRSNHGDRKMYVYSAAIVVASLLGLFFVFQSLFCFVWSFGAAVLCAGLILDLLRMSYCRMQFRRTPEGLAEWFTEVMKASVKKEDEKWHTISFEVPFSLMVVYMKCGAYGSLRLFCHRILELSSLWLGSITHIVLFRTPGEFEESLLDRYSRAESRIVKRITWLLQASCNLGSLAGLEEITRLAGKLFITFHVHHESSGFQLLSTLSLASRRNLGTIEFRDFENEILSTFSEVVKLLIERCVARDMPDTSTIFKVLSVIENKVKEIQRRDQTIDSTFLMRPFIEISRMLEYDRYGSFPGRREIFEELRRIFAQFSVYEESSRLAEI